MKWIMDRELQMREMNIKSEDSQANPEVPVSIQ